jgi:ABC-2 type transport system permease protein
MIANLKEIWQFKELLANLVRRELKVKYRNSVLGFLWSLLNPLLMMLVFAFVFGFIFRARGVGAIPKLPVFLLTGLLPWFFFNLTLSGSAASVVNAASLIKKVYFPRILIPLASVLANLVNFALELLVLFGFLVFFKVPFLKYIWLLPIIVAVELILVCGFSLIIATSNVYFRDIEHLISVILLLWFYGSPIIYPVEAVPERWLFFYKLNPMTGLVLMYRSILYYSRLPGLKISLYVIGFSLLVLGLGYWLFTRYEPYFAEEV